MEIKSSEPQHNASGLENRCGSKQKVIIFDGMAIVQSMKKNTSMKKMINFAEQFEKRMKRLLKGYLEGRVLFNH